MLKALVALIAIAGVVALGVFGPRWLMSDNNSQSASGVDNCNVLNDTCRWTQQGNLWDARLEESGVREDGTEYRLSVTTNMKSQRLLAVLRGESMYLGEYPVPMTRAGLAEDGSGQLWEARFTAPFCTTEPEMTWRIDLQPDMDSEADMPLKLTFRANGRA